MSPPGAREGLALDQAPPLAIPSAFFLLAPLAIAGAGVLLIVQGSLPLGSGGRAGSAALAHLGTLGLLGSVMIGAMYQMAPVVAGARVPAVHLAYGVHGAWAFGVSALVAGFLTGRPGLFDAASLALGLALLGFVVPVGVGLARTATRSWTVRGMRLAVASFALVGLLGLLFASLRAGHSQATALPGFDLFRWRIAHLGLGLTAWVGALLAAVSWQVLPMFYLAPHVPRAGQASVWAGAFVGVLGTALALFTATGLLRPWALLAPAAIAAWVLHPALSLPRLRARQRTRRDETVTAWMAALACAPLVGLLAGASVLLDDPRWGVAWVWLAVWGWAGLAVHAMLCRIAPFLVWFHRLSPLVGKVAVPPVRRLMPQERIQRAVQAHGASLVLGLLAIGTGGSSLARMTGVSLLLAAALLGRNLLAVLRFRPPAVGSGTDD